MFEATNQIAHSLARSISVGGASILQQRMTWLFQCWYYTFRHVSQRGMNYPELRIDGHNQNSIINSFTPLTNQYEYLTWIFATRSSTRASWRTFSCIQHVCESLFLFNKSMIVICYIPMLQRCINITISDCINDAVWCCAEPRVNHILDTKTY